MTEIEAIEMLMAYHKCQKLQVKGIYEDCNEKLCDNCDLCYAKGTTREHIESVKVAIQSLEKQIPKKPRDNGLRSGIFNVTKYYSCPRCGNVCLTEMMNERQNTSYCWDCGQKLDWSDEE